MSIIVTFYLFSASSVSPHHCLSTRRAQEKKKSKSKKHLPPILASWHCERIFLISRNLLLQNLNSYDMSWLKYRAQDIHVNVLLWGRVRGRLVQSLHSLDSDDFWTIPPPPPHSATHAGERYFEFESGYPSLLEGKTTSALDLGVIHPEVWRV